MTGADDRDLLQAAAGGDREAFDRFVRRHQASVFRFLRSIASGEADAEDALQEAFLSAWRGAGTYQGGASARGWILTVARNSLLRASRRRVGEPSAFEALDALGAQAGWGDGDPLESLIRRDLLGRAMAALDAHDREILILRDLEEFPGEEVAEMLGVGVPAMKSRLHRARLRLVAKLKEMAHG